MTVQFYKCNGFLTKSTIIYPFPYALYFPTYRNSIDNFILSLDQVTQLYQLYVAPTQKDQMIMSNI